MRKTGRILALALMVALPGCARNSSQGVYQERDVGKTTAVSFGTVISARTVDVVGKSSGAGALGGAAVGGALGSQIGNGAGNGAAIVGGLLLGAIAGAVAEQALRDHQGIEYTVILQSGVTLTVVQNIGEQDTPIKVGDRVIVQNSGGYQRVLPANNLPTAMQRPQGIKMIDGDKQ